MGAVLHRIRISARAWAMALLAAIALLGAGVVTPAGATPTTCDDHVVDVALSPGEPADQHVAVTLCVPRRATTVQVLLHGATYDRNYFDFPYRPALYSYVRAAHGAGFATLNVDRLGYGESSRPSSQLAGWDAQAFVIHQLVEKLRAGELGPEFSRVVTVGHSMGSVMAFRHAALYGDVDAIVNTGTAHSAGPGLQDLVAALYPAVEDPTFAHLDIDTGYVTTRPGTRGGLFYDARTSDPKLIVQDEQLKNTSIGIEGANLGEWRNTPPESSMTRDVDVPVLYVIGTSDMLLCGPGALDCTSRKAIYDLEKPHLPNAPLSVITIPATGHSLNLHWTAPATYLAIQAWIATRV